MSEKGVHKETIYHEPSEEMPCYWVVFYWPDESHPLIDSAEYEYFTDQDRMEEFENRLDKFDDWCSSQEEPLAVQ